MDFINGVNVDPAGQRVLCTESGGGGGGGNETILTGLPSQTGGSPLRIGNVYQSVIAGQVVSGRFYRQTVWPTLVHRVLLYDAAHTLVRTSADSVGEVFNVPGWFTVAFPTPFPLAAGALFTTVIDSPDGYVYSDGLGAVFNAAHVVQTSGVFGSVGSPPNWAGGGAFNYFVDAVWNTGAAATLVAGSRGFSYRPSDGALFIALNGTPVSFQGGFGFTATGALAVVASVGTDFHSGLAFDNFGRLSILNGGVTNGAVAGWPMSGPRVNVSIVA